MKISLVMSTLGRHADVLNFIQNLESQSFRDFELIILDQNSDTALVDSVIGIPHSFPLKHFHRPDVRGTSRGRNVGFSLATGDIIGFPDDDCTYPAWFLARILDVLEKRKTDFVCGRAADEAGRDINGRFEGTAQEISRNNVFSTQIEWVAFFKRAAFEACDGYDENIGPGAPSPWRANEGQDIVLRMLEKGYSGWYDPEIYGHHPELNVFHPDAAMRKKARGYARGMGYVLGRHRYSVSFMAKYILRSLGGFGLSLLLCNFKRAAYYIHVALGRTEGFLDGRQTAVRERRTS